ncbi:MAG: hypothetical protein A2W00_04965 [Candidatus Eisenbacteria bacterium RBG_16_71_46]|nr:MAG: hypothetical protein A2W00_04965 [Candidatus Eisenbacteria bacterium RBG_16_71_46]OGF21922.1 MAG: hypothetical protein A2V63_08145 [Candidatus Eisenbacteria bacterium RBG_19FT_COMBO_70_11]
MSRSFRIAALLALSVLGLTPGCAALQELAAVRTVTFAFAGVSDVRLAGVSIGAGSRFTSLGVSDAARLGAAVLADQVPLELVAHVSAANPRENTVTARLVQLGWTLFVEDRQMLAGQLANPVALAPGTSTDVPLTVRFDLLALGGGGARDLFDLALAIAGYGTVQKDLRLELVPTIDTSLGPIRYPAPVVVRRAAP